MSNFDRYVQYMRQDEADYTEFMTEVERKTDVEYSGSRVYKDIHLTRMVDKLLDKKGDTLLRLEEDEASTTSSPYLQAVCVEK